MRLVVCAVGRLKAGPERELEARYLERARALGRTLKLAPVDVVELPESTARRPPDRKADEAARLAAALPDGAAVIVLDERGRHLTSTDLAARLAALRDGGAHDLALVVGGPDGLADALRARADLVLAFGALTLPHQLVRVLLAEQLYRAMTLLSGHPYHRA